MSSDNMSATIVKTSLMAGLIGAGMALLLAPRSGRDTRIKLRQSANKLNTRARNEADNFAHSIGSNLDEMDNRLENIQEAVRIRRDRRQQSPVLTNWEEEV